ncbi:hypothetical protein, variant [Saprolegnia diclina VS20]|uniref:Ubiquitin-activating enzyme E1 C-terminal domain-containing protein n=1 Tax=Saprolegnia diclina (strain VS20) TaxID=1156394 RepID=T0QRD0_SAPDV|nr:hypothetical protein SDRG_05522 [Saprolegnia diclina VS20]XP_008609463.1 hypothetical protein, variant [Saprolegnia diclina VS20]EQC37300.1 hypothetical protein SDRG_05522 [Saprolegnia diclina VS20]EQC37301.1 hypothetical protein, variant [Saprolegnia diclina VS20]|eukprot:XP_008609462.1 hypothetical protein SDRG_05522 [Saprolegnia diclina VS20]
MATANEFFARSLVAYGSSWMETITSMHVLVVGLRSVGVELVKNLMLHGIRDLTLYDDALVTDDDLPTSTWYGPRSIGQKRSVVIKEAASAKSPYTTLRTLSGVLTPDLLLHYHLVLFASGGLLREEIVGLNEFCRAQVPPIGTIVVESRGVLASLFVDFGPSHEAWEDDSLEFTVASLDTSTGLVVVREDVVEQRLQMGDVVAFSFCTQDTSSLPWPHAEQCCIIRLASPSTFYMDAGRGRPIGDLTTLPRLKLRRVRGLRQLAHKSYRESILHPTLVECPCFLSSKDTDRSMLLHCVLHGLYTYAHVHGQWPEANNVQHANEVLKCTRTFIAASEKGQCAIPTAPPSDASILELARCASTELVPLSATVAGLAAREAIKFVGLGLPLTQVWYWDATNALPHRAELAKETMFLDHYRHHEFHVRALYGQTALAKLQSARIALVGCGALGSEIAKNLSLLGVGGTNLAKCTLVDGALVQVIDLASHATFASKDVGSKKAVCVKSALANDCKVLTIHLDPAHLDTAFDEAFWTSFDVLVCTASSALLAKYLDEQSFVYKKPFLLATADAWRGSLMAYVPEVTERWIAREVDATLPLHVLDQVAAQRSRFQNASIENNAGLQHARAFEVQRIAFFAQSVLTRHFGSHLVHVQTYCRDRAQNKPLRYNPDWLQTTLATFGRLQCLGLTPNSCLDQAFGLLQALFAETSIVFDVSQTTHLALLHVTAVLLARNVQLALSLNEIAAASWAPPAMAYKNDEGSEAKHPSLSDVQAMLGRLVITPFNATDDANLHVVFVQRWCNAMAATYDVAAIDFYTCKGLCGVSPHVVSTASVVAGIVTLELVKLVLQKANAVREVTYAPHTSILRFERPAAPLQLSSIALEPTRGVALRMCPEQMTLWRQLVIPCTLTPRLLTVEDIERYLQAKYEVHVECIVWQQTTLYRSTDACKRTQSLFDLWRLATGLALRETFLMLEMRCSDADGDVVLPPTKLVRPHGL